MEINPALYTIATFPFLFGVMFGDILHGGLLFLFGLYLIFYKNAIVKPANGEESSLKMLLPARYLFALMGFFAFYCGFLYNDFASLRLNLFGSCYDLDKMDH
jgi:V-type H+-transporting ATPase subunit a